MSGPAVTAGDRRRDVVGAAAAVLLEAGLPAVTHRAVADRAGLPLGCATAEFPALDDLRRAAVAAAAEEEHLRGRRRLDGGEHRRLAGCLVDVVAGLHRLERPVSVVARYQVALEAARTPAVRAAALGWDAGVAELVAAELVRHRTGLDAGRVLALVDGRLVGWLSRGAPDAEELLASVDADLDALSPSPSGRRRSDDRGPAA